MERKITFKFLTDRGDIEEINIDIDFPNDIDAMEYLDNLDKSNIMAKYDMNTILDYHFFIDKSVRFRNFIDAFTNEQVKIDYVATHNRMYPIIHDLPIRKQFLIVSSALNIGYDSAINAYNEIKNIHNEYKERAKTKKIKEDN